MQLKWTGFDCLLSAFMIAVWLFSFSCPFSIYEIRCSMFFDCVLLLTAQRFGVVLFLFGMTLGFGSTSIVWSFLGAGCSRTIASWVVPLTERDLSSILLFFRLIVLLFFFKSWPSSYDSLKIIRASSLIMQTGMIDICLFYGLSNFGTVRSSLDSVSFDSRPRSL